jgi:uncharacterized protein (TIGR02246 family)
MDTEALTEFASRYAAAWCSQDPARVAAFFAPDGSLTINGGPPSVGRDAIAASAQSFMTAFPDMVVSMDAATLTETGAVFRWTLSGRNTGPGGTGNPMMISGFEEWQFGPDGLVARSRGHFDAADYERQITASPPI